MGFAKHNRRKTADKINNFDKQKQKEIIIIYKTSNKSMSIIINIYSNNNRRGKVLTIDVVKFTYYIYFQYETLIFYFNLYF